MKHQVAGTVRRGVRAPPNLFFREHFKAADNSWQVMRPERMTRLRKELFRDGVAL
jgi:hypothetical protein